MNEEVKRLSSRKYATVVTREETTDGGYCYIAYHPEFPTGKAQGVTVQEAEANLVEVTEMVIEHLLESGLPVPEPMLVNTALMSAVSLQPGSRSVSQVAVPGLR